ncbi:MAG: hypothetical protein ACR2G0_09220 [Chthoniobacterales bacterium]
MKVCTLVILLATFSQAALADDLGTTPTPTASPTAAILARPGRVIGAIRHEERREARQDAVETKVQVQKQQRVERVAAATARAQARQAARAHDKADREVAAQNPSQTQKEKPQLNSELMTRMGFSEQQIAEQKAREQAAAATQSKLPAPANSPNGR